MTYNVSTEFMVRTPKNVYSINEAKQELAALELALKEIEQKEAWIEAARSVED